jgi:hypothetical protein
MKLFNKAIDNKLFKQYALGSDLSKQEVVAKIFNPQGAQSWFILNSDPEDPDYLWAIVDLGYGAEIGSVSRNELESYRGRFGLGFERDLSFDPINAEELYEGLRRGEYYAKGGNLSRDRKFLNHSQNFEVEYSKGKNRAGYGNLSFADGGSLGDYDVVIDGDWDEPKKFKTFSLAKKWIYENIKNHESLELVDSYGDTIYVEGDATKEDLDWLFSNNEASAFADGGEVSFIDYKDCEIMYEPHYKKYYANDVEFDSLKEAKEFIDSGEIDPSIRDAYSKGLFADGGKVNNFDEDQKFENFKNSLIKYSDKYELGEGYNSRYKGLKNKIGDTSTGEYLIQGNDISWNYLDKKGNIYNSNEVPELIIDLTGTGVYLGKRGFADGGSVNVGYNVFNYTDNIYATDEVFKTKALANKFIKEFRSRFSNQGYYRDNRMNKINIQDIDLLAIPSDFNPFKKFADGGEIEVVYERRADFKKKPIRLLLLNKGKEQKGYTFSGKEQVAVLENYNRNKQEDLEKLWNLKGYESKYADGGEVTDEDYAKRLQYLKMMKNNERTAFGKYNIDKEIRQINTILEHRKNFKNSFADGGDISEFSDNQRMIMNQNVELEHHHEELEDILEDEMPVPAWVVAKMATATNSVSDITHYLDGQKELMEDEDEDEDEEENEDEVENQEAIENKEVVEPINVSAGTKAELTKKFTDDAWGNLRGFLKGMEGIDLRNDYTFDYKNEQFEVEPIINSDENGVSNAVFTIFDGDGEEVGEVAYSREGGKQKFTANSDYFQWNDAKFEDGGYFDGTIPKVSTYMNNYADGGGIEDDYKGTIIDDSISYIVKKLPYNYQIEDNSLGLSVYGQKEALISLKNLLHFKYGIDSEFYGVDTIGLKELKIPSGQTVDNDNYAKGGSFDEWRKGSTASFSTKKQASERLSLMEKSNETDADFRNLRVEKTSNGYAVKFDFKDKMENGGFMSNVYAKGGEIAKAEILGLSKNIMGTTDIEMKITGMRKPQDFIVYPIGKDDAGNVITIQSDTRIGQINLVKGVGVMSQSHSNGAYFVHLQMDKLTSFTISESDLEDLKAHIFKTSGANVGTRGVVTDNSGASGVYAKGGSFEKVMWQDVEIGDSARVKELNRMGLITHTYGRKFNIKFPNGTEKTFDASDLEFYKLEKDQYELDNDNNYAKGGITYYKNENERLSRPKSDMEEKVFDKVKNQINSELFVGNFGWKTPNNKTAYGYLYSLDDFDKNLIKDLKLKQGEEVFRYVTRVTAISGMMPFIKINIEKALLYFPMLNDSDDIIFETRGVTPLWISLIEGSFADGGSVKRTRRTKDQIRKDEYNKEVDLYNWYIVNVSERRVETGFEYKEDAIELLSDYDGDKNFKVVSKKTLKTLGIDIPNENWKYAYDGFMDNVYAKGGIVVTKIQDIPNLTEKVNKGQVTYRGLGMGKLANDFYNLAGERGTKIKVDGKEYFITDSDYRKLDWDFENNQWLNKIKFSAPTRNNENGGFMDNVYADGGKTDKKFYSLDQIEYDIEYRDKNGEKYSEIFNTKDEALKEIYRLEKLGFFVTSRKRSFKDDGTFNGYFADGGKLNNYDRNIVREDMENFSKIAKLSKDGNDFIERARNIKNISPVTSNWFSKKYDSLSMREASDRFVKDVKSGNFDIEEKKEALLPKGGSVKKDWWHTVVNPNEDFNNFDDKMPIDWDVDDFKSWVVSNSDLDGNADKEVLDVVKIPKSKLTVEYLNKNGSGENNNEFYKKYGNWQSALYDIFTQMKKDYLFKKSLKYILKADIKTVTFKTKNGKEVTYSGADVLNGNYVLAKGGDITSKATYFGKNNVVEVELKDGSKVKPANGYWVKKGAEPIGAEPTPTTSGKSEPKISTTEIRKDARGNWRAETNVENFNGYDWRISTVKTYSGNLVSSAQGGKSEDTGSRGVRMFMYTMYQDPHHTLEVSKPKRLTDKVVSEQHDKALAKFKKFMETGMFKSGGKISNFDKLSAKVAKEYEGKPVKSQYQEEYGRYYSKEEAQEVGDKVAGKVKAMQTDSKAFGGLFSGAKKMMTPVKYPDLEGKQVALKTGKFVQVFSQSDDVLSVLEVGKVGSGERPHSINISEVDMDSFKAGGKVGTKKTNSGSETLKQANDLAKKIRMDGESWLDAKRRAFAQLKK